MIGIGFFSGCQEKNWTTVRGIANYVGLEIETESLTATNPGLAPLNPAPIRPPISLAYVPLAVQTLSPGVLTELSSHDCQQRQLCLDGILGFSHLHPTLAV
jgi:hypothetical protein